MVQASYSMIVYSTSPNEQDLEIEQNGLRENHFAYS